MGKSCCRFSLKNILGILIFPPLGTSAGNQSIWRETKLVSFIIFMMILPNIQTVSFDILELVKMSFIEKRKPSGSSFYVFCKVSAHGYSPGAGTPVYERPGQEHQPDQHRTSWAGDFPPDSCLIFRLPFVTSFFDFVNVAQILC